MKPFPFAAIVFDLDGVLADTEPLNFRAIQDMFDPNLVLLDDQAYTDLFGLDYFATAEYLRRRYHLTESVESMARRQEASALRRIDQELEPAPGAVALIRSLSRRNVPIGLASNSPVIYVNHVLRRLKVDQFIPFPVGRDDVARGKPEPDPYLAACERLRVNPSESLAVEDSQVGLQSALAAGLSVALLGPKKQDAIPPRAILCADIAALAAYLLRW